MKSLRVLIVSLFIGFFINGCANFGYYLQSIGGQMQLMNQQRPITAVIADSGTSQTLKKKLDSILRIREFAIKELGLPKNKSYSSYVDLHRPYVVWNVFAAPEFSIKPHEWCFAFAGCVNYRGYFSQQDAEKFSQQLKREGYDVYVGGVPAYSTLGWLNDPVLNTFVDYPETEIARIVFHELAHQVAYAKNDSVFNESFAVAVEIEGLKRWLQRQGDSEQQKEFAKTQLRREQFSDLILAYRRRLDELYSESSNINQMRAVKKEIFSQLQSDYQVLKQSWGNYTGYDHWFSQDLNNAQLASVVTYAERVPAFQALLISLDKDLDRFYSEVKKLAGMEKEQRLLELEKFGKARAVETL